MKVLTVTYGRKITDNHYGSLNVEVVLEVESGEKAADVLHAAKTFVHRGLGIPAPKSDTPEKDG